MKLKSIQKATELLSLFRKEKRKYYENFNINCITDNNKDLQKRSNHFFMTKSHLSLIMLNDKNAFICDDEECA